MNGTFQSFEGVFYFPAVHCRNDEALSIFVWALFMSGEKQNNF